MTSATALLIALLAGLAGRGIGLRSAMRAACAYASGSRPVTPSSAAARRSRSSASASSSSRRERLTARVRTVREQQFRAYSETFLKLARESLSVQNERAKGDLAAREQAIDGLVRPIRETLERAEPLRDGAAGAGGDRITTDTSTLTSIANDYNFDQVFSKQVARSDRKATYCSPFRPAATRRTCWRRCWPRTRAAWLWWR